VSIISTRVKPFSWKEDCLFIAFVYDESSLFALSENAKEKY